MGQSKENQRKTFFFGSPKPPGQSLLWIRDLLDPMVLDSTSRRRTIAVCLSVVCFAIVSAAGEDGVTTLGMALLRPRQRTYTLTTAALQRTPVVGRTLPESKISPSPEIMALNGRYCPVGCHCLPLCRMASPPSCALPHASVQVLSRLL